MASPQTLLMAKSTAVVSGYGILSVNLKIETSTKKFAKSAQLPHPKEGAGWTSV